MKRVRVEIPFHLSTTDTDCIRGDVIDVTEETLARIKAIDVNMVSVLGDAETGNKSEPANETKTEKTSAAKKGKSTKTSGAKGKATN